jgi:ELWxxDGT repeat protein
MKRKLLSRPFHFGGGLTLALLLLCTSALQVSAQIALVKDINPMPYPTDVYQAVELNDVVYIHASRSLWKSAPGGTVQLKELNIYRMFTFNDQLYFYANDGAHGDELWRSDGTSEGTIMLKDIEAGNGSSGPQRIEDDPLPIAFTENILFFIARNSENGSELWRTDGTPEGTFLLRNIAPGQASSNITELTSANNLLFFVATNGENGKEVWRSDGTVAGTFLLKDIIRGPISSNPTDLIAYQNSLFFAATDGVAGYELWTSDGSTAGTQMFVDIRSGKPSSGPGSLTISGSTLFFHAATDAYGRELWKTNGTPQGTHMVKEIRPGVNTSGPKFMTDVEGTLYFAFNDAVHGNEFWKSDGTPEGTSLAFELKPGTPSGIDDRTYKVFTTGGYIYIYRPDRLWGSDGTQEGTKNITGVGDYYNTTASFYPHNGVLYIVESDWIFTDEGESLTDYWLSKVSGLNSTEVYPIGMVGSKPIPAFTSSGILFTHRTEDGRNILMRSDGTAGGTFSFFGEPFEAAGSDPNGIVQLNGNILFEATGASGKKSLWKMDGTTTAVQQLFETEANHITQSGNRIYFVNKDGHLWKSNGTTEGTMLVRKFGGESHFHPQNLTDVNGTLFFSAIDNNGTPELWKSTGDFAGTVRVKDIYPGAEASRPSVLTNFKGTLFFVAEDPVNWYSLWRSDGTDIGTRSVQPADASNAYWDPYDVVATTNAVYFTAYNSEEYDLRLFKTDGTPAGTVLVNVIGDDGAYVRRVATGLHPDGANLYFTASGADGSYDIWIHDGTAGQTTLLLNSGLSTVHFLKGYSGRMFFITSNRNTGVSELWSSAGTPGSTHLVKSLPYGSEGYGSVILDNVLYFESPAGTLWRTDGTECGTFAVPVAGAQPVTLPGRTAVEFVVNKDRRIVFAGSTSTTGTELYKLEKSQAPKSPCALSANAQDEGIVLTERSMQWEKNIQNSPNPFERDFTLRINSPENKKYSATILSMSGNVSSKMDNLETNTDYEVGKELRSGIYLLRVVMDNRVEVRRVAKIK